MFRRNATTALDTTCRFVRGSELRNHAVVLAVVDEDSHPAAAVATYFSIRAWWCCMSIRKFLAPPILFSLDQTEFMYD